MKIGIIAVYAASMLGSTIKPCYDLIHFSHHRYVSIIKKVMQLYTRSWGHRFVSIQEDWHLRVVRHLAASRCVELATISLNHGESCQEWGLHSHVMSVWVVIRWLSTSEHNLRFHGIELNNTFALLIQIERTRTFLSEVFLVIVDIKPTHHLLPI